MDVRKLSVYDIVVEDRSRQDKGDIEGLAEMIEAKGQLQPVTVSPLPDGRWKLLAGERRYLAIRLLERDEIEAVIRDTDDELDMKEVELIENLGRKDFEWAERAKLERDIHELKRKKLGFTQSDTAAMLGTSTSSLNRHIILAEAMEAIPEIGKMKVEDDAWKAFNKLREDLVVEELVKRGAKRAKEQGIEVHEEEEHHPDEASSKPGLPKITKDIIRWAENHYNIGDALEGLSDLNPGIAGFAEVDPPYGIDLNVGQQKRGGNVSHYNEIPAEEYEAFLTNATALVYRALMQNTFCVWWFAPSWQREVYDALVLAGFDVSPIPALWVKPSGQTNNPTSNLASCYEPFYYAKKGRPVLRKQGRSNIFSFDPIPPAKKEHPTERPIPLMREILSTFAHPRMTVLCPFLGSGNTILSSYLEDMICFGWDLSEQYRNRFILKAAEMDRASKKEEAGEKEEA